MQTTQLAITGMVCDACREAVEDALLQLPDVLAVEIDLDSGQALVRHEPELDTRYLVRTVERAGYRAEVAQPTAT